MNGGFEPVTFLNHFWSLSVEEHFYLFWPLLVFLLNEKQLIRVSVLLIIGSRLLSFYMMQGNEEWVPVYVFTFCRMDALITGAVIAVLLRIHPELLSKYLKRLFFMSVLVMVSVFGYALIRVHGFSNSWNPRNMILSTHSLVFTVNTFFFGCLMLLSLAKNKFSDWLQHPALVFCGKYSYGMYVYHLILFKCSEAFLYASVQRVFKQPFLIGLTVGVISTVGAIVVAFLSYELIEKRFIFMKKRFSSIAE
jgi:peptidoglycan/LPS O-acetylase OafA/YrhL